jgi:drug/metabolite transporter (DMT)-like permease
MAGAGFSWGLYSLKGRGNAHPLAATTANFARAVPFTIVLSAVLLSNAHLSTRGVMLALLSGTLASGAGYAVWYAALKHLSRTRAAVVQLSVPALAALGGVFFLSEPISLRLLLSACVILGGVAMAVLARRA